MATEKKMHEKCDVAQIHSREHHENLMERATKKEFAKNVIHLSSYTTLFDLRFYSSFLHLIFI
jgi:hypothetical protein